MSGTETYAPGGAIGGGSDNFTWYQNAFDQTTLTCDQTAGTGTQADYALTVYDTVQDTMSDVGSDVLGPSDSIVSGGDSDSITDLRDMSSTITDDGSSATPLRGGSRGGGDHGRDVRSMMKGNVILRFARSRASAVTNSHPSRSASAT